MTDGKDNPIAAAWLDGTENADAYKPHGIRGARQPVVDDIYADGAIHRLRYIGHRTTRKQSVGLMFAFIGNEEKRAVAFYNVDLKKRDGSTYAAGNKGRFNLNEGRKFRRVYQKITGKEKPKSGWSRIAETLKGEFKDIVFTAEIENCTDKDNKPYIKAKLIRFSKRIQNA